MTCGSCVLCCLSQVQAVWRWIGALWVNSYSILSEEKKGICKNPVFLILHISDRKQTKIRFAVFSQFKRCSNRSTCMSVLFSFLDTNDSWILLYLICAFILVVWNVLIHRTYKADQTLKLNFFKKFFSPEG